MASPEEQLDELAMAAMDQFAYRLVDWMKEMVGVSYPPSSEPYNPPHKRTGNLQAGIGIVELSQSGPITRFVVESSVDYSDRLNSGTSVMKKRPFMDLSRDKMEEMLPESVQATFDGHEVTWNFLVST